MQCSHPIKVKNGTFPCGKCINCRMAKSREWCSRLMHESTVWDSSLFVTLTYDNKYLPSDYGLHRKELQLFVKRLRKALYPRKIKYFACGEYGSHPVDKDTGLYKYPTHLGRPHFHLIVFGIAYHERDIIKRCWTFCDWNMLLDRKCFGTVTYDSCRYVTDYIFKKYSGQLADEVYLSKGVEIPFKLCSTKIGLDFCMNNADNLIFNNGFLMHGVKMHLPRYYADKLGVKLVDQSNMRYLAWSLYADKHSIPEQDIPDYIASCARQREKNALAMCELHSKGDL